MLQQALAHVTRSDATIASSAVSYVTGLPNKATPILRSRKSAGLAVQRVFDNVLEKCLAAMAALESGPIDDLCQVRSQLHLMLDRLADLGDSCRVRGAVYFTSH